MKYCFELFPQPTQTKDNGSQRCCLIKQKSANQECIDKELWFLYPVGIPLPKDDDCDAYLLATLLPAMQVQADIVVHGSLSLELLSNITELKHIWNKWLPKQYHLIDIKADSIRENEAVIEGAVCAFSGGVDAQFTAYRHAKGLAGYSTRKLLAGVFIQGFDIPLNDKQGFDSAAKIASTVLKDLNIALLLVKTNIRELWDINWEDYHAAAIASVLCGLKKYAGTGLIGSGDSYDVLLSPWGSHPMTDPLLSSGSFRIIHDGAGFNRLQKLEVLTKWQIGLENLRVCWAGGKHDSNCGRCEKCVRTRMNLLLVGAQNPKCFSTPIEPSVFSGMVLHSEAMYIDWSLIRNKIIETGKGQQWLPHVEQVLKRKPLPRLERLLPFGSKRREWVKKLLSKSNRSISR
ncbi:hypothetical protein [Psychrobacter sp. DM8]|uniref:hypothetical protein n=1 Tax=Psychrobacter sp. DM8 TaxID=3440636 RepID=UPI003F50C8E5